MGTSTNNTLDSLAAAIASVSAKVDGVVAASGAAASPAVINNILVGDDVASTAIAEKYNRLGSGEIEFSFSSLGSYEYIKPYSLVTIDGGTPFVFGNAVDADPYLYVGKSGETMSVKFKYNSSIKIESKSFVATATRYFVINLIDKVYT